MCTGMPETYCELERNLGPHLHDVEQALLLTGGYQPETLLRGCGHIPSVRQARVGLQDVGPLVAWAAVRHLSKGTFQLAYIWPSSLETLEVAGGSFAADSHLG